jgi:hypothetical protein
MVAVKKDTTIFNLTRVNTSNLWSESWDEDNLIKNRPK